MNLHKYSHRSNWCRYLLNWGSVLNLLWLYWQLNRSLHRSVSDLACLQFFNTVKHILYDIISNINSLRGLKWYYFTFKSHLIVVKICQYFIYLYLFLEDRCDSLSSSDFPSSRSQVFSTLMVSFFDLFHILPFPPSFPPLDSHIIQFHLLSSYSKFTDCY